MLFTTQPLPEKISDFASLVHTSVGPPAQEGDVRIEFQDGTWEVKEHAIAIAPQPLQNNPGSTGESTIALATNLAIGPPIKLLKRPKK